MKRNIAIQLKAAFLLMVFGLNTLVGFACAVGLDMGFNSSHHHEGETGITVHVHADGKKHTHHDKTGKHQHAKKNSSKKGHCCNEDVLKFQNTDKNLDQNAKSAIALPGYLTLTVTFFSTRILRSGQSAAHKYIIRNFHPPPTDIRIAIRSFQI